MSTRNTPAKNNRLNRLQLGRRYLGRAARLTITSILLWGLSSFYVAASVENDIAILEGFQPGSKIEYAIIPAFGDSFVGKGVIRSDGSLPIPAPPDMFLETDNLVYNVNILPSDQSGQIKVTLTFNRQSGEVSLLGKGFDEFSDLQVTRAGQTQSSRADWAGQFRDRTPLNFEINRHNPYVFAFFDGNIASDMPANPHIIKVLTAPGGGILEPPNGTNGYDNDVPNVCDPAGISGIPSYCQPANTPHHKFRQFGNPPAEHMRRVSHFIMDNYVRALMMMTEQLSATMMMHMQGIGKLLDAKQQLETQRLIQQMQARAHKDYHPSEMMCQVGSFVKSLPRAEEVSKFNKLAMNNILMEAYTGQRHRSTAEGYALDIESRIRQFRWVYCDPRDNNNGLAFMCEHDQDQVLSNSTVGSAPASPLPPIGTSYTGGGIGAQTPTAASHERKNKDIDFTRLLGNPLTLKIDFTDATKTNDEEDILALARNIYWPRALTMAEFKGLTEKGHQYSSARRMIAMHNVAQNSLINLAAMKSETDVGLGGVSGWNYMKSLMREFGLSDTEIHRMLGDYPSYYAQMEVLTKKMYQSPDFFTNLYDKPVNVNRIGAALEAIKVMQQRDMLLSRQRTEMLTSLMVETELMPVAQEINGNIAGEIEFGGN